MDAVAEGHVPLSRAVELAADVEPLRVVEARRVAVRGGKDRDHRLPRLHDRAAELGRPGRHATDPLNRRLESEDLLDRARNR